MKHILILLALVFSISCKKSNKSDDSKKVADAVEVEETQPASAEQNYQRGNGHYAIGERIQAFDEFEKAAEQGHARAQFAIGFMYKQGEGVEQDYTQAFTWYKKSAEQGYASSQNNLGDLYYNGRGVEQDYKQAIDWYKKAAEQGHARAQNNLGWMYAFGYGIEQDYEQAFIWVKKAAEQGHAKAQNNLGVMYLNGQGVDEDYVLAYMWFNVATSNGSSSAQNNRDTIAKKMSVEQITEARDKTITCVESKYKDCDSKSWYQGWFN